MLAIDWAALTKTLAREPIMVPAWLCHGNKRIQVYIRMSPLPEEQAKQARRKARERARKKGRSLSRRALLLCSWVFILTTLPPQVLDTETVSALLYRVRWQVELLIKRLKSLLDVDGLRASKGSKLAELYLHGKLLYAAVIEKIMRKRFSTARATLDGARELTYWRVYAEQ